VHAVYCVGHVITFPLLEDLISTVYCHMHISTPFARVIPGMPCQLLSGAHMARMLSDLEDAVLHEWAIVELNDVVTSFFKVKPAKLKLADIVWEIPTVTLVLSEFEFDTPVVIVWDKSAPPDWQWTADPGADPSPQAESAASYSLGLNLQYSLV